MRARRHRWLGWAFSLVATLAVVPARGETFATPAPHAILVDHDSGAVLFEKGADESLPPAGLAKIMTALLAFEALEQGRLKPDTELLVTEAAWRRGGAPARGPTMFAALNSRIKVSDLLLGLAVASANDAALVLADGVAGSEENFVARMNARARELGLTRTVYRNATGIPHPEQTSSARDLARLTSQLIRAHRDAYAVFATREMTWNRITQRNRNPLVAAEGGVDGVQLGQIDDTHFSIVASAVRDGQRLVAVASGLKTARDRDTEAKRLLDWGFRSFEARPMFEARANVGALRVFGGDRATVNVGPATPVTLLVARSGQDRVTARILYRGPLRPPVEEGRVAARLQLLRNDVVALEVPLVTLERVETGGLWPRARDAAWGSVADWVRRGFARLTGGAA